MKLIWEKVEDSIERTRTPTGWLVREVCDVAHFNARNHESITTGYDWRVAMTFVPDPDGQWLIEQKG